MLYLLNGVALIMINSKASANGMIIGNNLYQITKAFDYVYKEGEGYENNSYQKYSVYSITSKKKRTMLNPFNSEF